MFGRKKATDAYTEEEFDELLLQAMGKIEHDKKQKLPKRTYWLLKKWTGSYGGQEVRFVKDAVEGNLVSSLCEDDRHMPALDIDFPCHLLESKTPGHYHLLIDKPMTWNDYAKLLETLLGVGLIEQGFYDVAIQRKMTTVAVHNASYDQLRQKIRETGNLFPND